MEEENDVETGSSANHEEEVPQESKTEWNSDKSKDKQAITHRVPYYKLFSFADQLDGLLMAVGSVAAVGNGISIPLMTIVFGEVVNSFGQNSDNERIVDAVSKVSLKFVYLALGSAAAAFTQVASWMVSGERQAARIRSLYLKTLLRQEIGFFDKEANMGEIIGRMSGDTVLIQNAMGEKVGKFIQLTATFTGGLIIAFLQGWRLTLIMISCIPLLVFSGAVLSITVGKLASRGQAAYTVAAAVAEQAIGSIRTVASFTAEKQAMRKYNESVTKAYKSDVQEGIASGLGFGMVMSIVFCTYALAVWYGGKMILEKGYSGGDVINVVFAVLTGSMALGQASPCLGAFAAGQAAAYKMFEVIHLDPQIDAYDTSGKILEDIDGNIELRDIYFSYPTRPNEQILSGFSLSIPSGTTTALVGESGSGKSTVISLVERFYDPQAGEVLIDGINLQEFQLKWIRQNIGLVSQEPVLFASSIRDNIAYGKANATLEEIRAAARLANAAIFINKLPQGLETMVGEHGSQLSGGQKQRVAIARAILKDPRILLLDEATSALDAESESIVQAALDRIMINRTTVIIAHRLSTIKHANTIAVLHHGKITEKGSHYELTKDPNGLYSQLVRLQEISVASEQMEAHDADCPELTTDRGTPSSQLTSPLHSVSHCSSGTENSDRHSFTVPFGFTSRVNNVDHKSEEEAAVLKQKYREVSLLRVASLNKPEIPVLLLGTLAAAANGVILPIFGMLISSMIKTFYEPKDKLREDTKFWAFVFIALAVAALLVYPLRSYLFSVAGCRLIERVRSMCFEKVIHMEISWFDEAEHSSGALGARLSVDAAALRVLVGDALGLAVQNTATTVAGVVIAFVANWQLALIVLGLIPLLGVNSFAQMRSLRGFSADAKKSYEEASQVANDAVRSIRTVASFCAEDRVMELYQKKCRGPIQTGIWQGLISGAGFGLAMFLLFSVYACSFYAGARLVEQGKTTFSDVFQVFFALTTTAVGIAQSSSLIPDATKAKASVSSIVEILDGQSKIDSSNESGMMIEDVKGEIKFRHVSFKYPTRPDIQIFHDLCLAIHNGKTVALVGESGGGKSTIISLLQRFYDPNSGQILLDGIEIQKLQLKWLRQQMGLVSQEPVLFNCTVRENIAYGKGDALESEIFTAAQLANAHRFISSLQQGYDTLVGERGVQLSGGQKQRLAIARAIVKQPKILLLDEATSALDAESEQVVQDALDRVMVNRTTVIVAHRLSTIKGADMIVVVKNGVIAEKGKHESLIGIKNGLYASLVALHSSALQHSSKET